ncbi:hypothetical protein OYE22_18585 [Streptomyces sp. 71268]|uniref:hypothetical protein n=1 Tax=Streptomyces sp. 71268 TaxID=3002640 RepID=UPI0023F81E08|nr:hypothetical protein [Streptomyces sp. 71268]WEV26980.1 hypothetical protein OYE22_18585 [Streptomyces sp. 71268]
MNDTFSGQAPCASSPARPVAVQVSTTSPIRNSSAPMSKPSGMPRSGARSRLGSAIA